jgi:phage host-nuclease inhibitor protein Gam
MEALKLEHLDLDCPEENEIEVNDNEQAAIAMRRIAAHDKEVARIEGIVHAEIERVQNWAANEVERLQRQKQFFAAPLESFLRNTNEQSQGKVKSLKFPSGTAQLRKSPDKIVVDESFDQRAMATEWEGGSTFVKISYAVDKKQIMNAVKDTGQIPPWAVLEPGETKFSYKLND